MHEYIIIHEKQDRAAWIRLVRDMHAFYQDREREYWEAVIRRRSSEPKKLWNTFDDLLGRRSSSHRTHTPSFTADAFLERLTAKITSIRDATSTAPPPDYPPTDHRLSTRREVTSAELRALIVTSAPK